MDKETDSLVTSSELTTILVSVMLGVGVLSLANSVVKTAKQDGWICCILGAIYPLYMVFIASYLCKKSPKENILTLSKKCMGKILGTTLNIVFIGFFLLIGSAVASGISNLLKIYMVTFLSNYQFLLMFFLIPAFIAYKGIKTLTRVSEVIFYVTLPLLLVPIAALKEGNLLNVMPVFSSGLINILKASKETAYAYTGIEILFLIYPYLRDGKQLKKSGIKSIVITVLIYTWFVFTTIYYLGIDIIPKFIWSSMSVSEAVVIPIINNFRYIFMVLWSAILFRTIAIYYYGFTYGLSETIKKIKRKDFVLLVYPLYIWISAKYGIPTFRGNILDKIIPLYSGFNLVYITIIALILAMKKGGKYEKKLEK
jgi:spore germination protein